MITKQNYVALLGDEVYKGQSVPDLPCLSVLQLLQLADSALPVGSMSHSFGLEALVFDEDIEHSVQMCPASLGWYLEDWLSESLLVDAVFCRAAHAHALQGA